MREIKFKGYNSKNNTWIVGCYILNRGAHFVCPDEFADGKSWNDYEVNPETVCQYTGLKDKDGKEIWEGDIIRFRGSIDSVIEFQHGAFGFDGIDSFIALAGNPNFTFNPFDTDNDFEIIGNIHDNKELLSDK